MWEEFDQLSVSGEGEDREPFDRWHVRVREEIPHVPPCVAEHWLYRHGNCTPYTWLPLGRLRFEQQTWDLATVLKIGEGVEPNWSPSWSEELGHSPLRRESWLGEYMLTHGTWPVPIIVFDNDGSVQPPHGLELARWHLIEGHMRSAYMDHLAQTQQAKPHHRIWVVTIAPEEPAEPEGWSTKRGQQYFREAVRDLATGQGLLQERLSETCRNFRTVLPQEIPRQHGARLRFVEVLRRMSRFRDLPPGTFNDKEARAIAIMIFEVREILEGLDRDLEVNGLRAEREKLRAEVATLRAKRSKR